VDALALLTGDAQTFLDKAWASRVHLHEANPEDLGALLSVADADRLITSSGLRTPALRVVKDGDVCAHSAFTRSATVAGTAITGLVDARKALALYEQGATLVLQALHRYWPPLIELVRRLEFALGHPCQANAYLTPPGAQGFARHTDSHDVFVFGTHGSKLWHITEPGPDGPLERQIVIEPGLCAYLPTGTPHWARTQGEASLHVTIGVNRLTWRDVLRQATDRLLADERYDAAAPAGYLDDPGRLADPLGGRLHALGAQLAGLDPAASAAAAGAEFLAGRPPALAGGLLDRTVIDSMDDRTTLERRPTAACVLQTDADRLRVLTGDRELRMPAWVRPAMEFVRDHDRFVVAELAQRLDGRSRQVLCRRLVREGLLRVVG
jgi:mannose-6-phosphate isomerase-like protein (cupin superfamily)